jgi:hypothetical protein
MVPYGCATVRLAFSTLSTPRRHRPGIVLGENTKEKKNHTDECSDVWITFAQSKESNFSTCLIHFQGHLSDFDVFH